MIHVTGTLINAGTVLIGTTAGALLRGRLPERIRETVMDGLGLMTIVVGVDSALAVARTPLKGLVAGATGGAVPVLVVLGSILLGGMLGEVMRIERSLETMGDALKRTFGRGERRFTEGFVVASLVFCVGPLTILGSIRDGLSGDYSLLALKAMLDGFAALAFASALGWGVGFSVLTILLYQGGLSVAAASLAGAIRDPAMSPAVAVVTATGGVLIIGIGLRLLRIREIRVANFLPSLLLAPLAVVIVERLS